MIQVVVIGRLLFQLVYFRFWYMDTGFIALLGNQYMAIILIDVVQSVHGSLTDVVGMVSDVG